MYVSFSFLFSFFFPPFFLFLFFFFVFCGFFIYGPRGSVLRSIQTCTYLVAFFLAYLRCCLNLFLFFFKYFIFSVILFLFAAYVLCLFALCSPSVMADPVESSALTFSLQALLHRHESYMADAEGEHRRLLHNIVALEEERRAIQEDNTRIISENRSLGEQLDWLNNTVAYSETQINSLSATLQSTEAEMRRVSAAAARATELENDLAKLEAEQAVLQEGLVTAKDGEKAAVQRWKRAEASRRELQTQVEQMEREASEERERHAELVQRLERRRTVERELDGAAGRLKGAAAAAAHEVGRQPIVSRFVRDILQDNAKLQIDITEMRELLENSHHEVQGLRDEVLRGSRPGTAKQAHDDEGDGETRSSPALSRRLSQELDNVASPEYHIHHHHYHPKDGPRLLARRMNKKRRSVGFPATLHSAAHLRNSSTSSNSTILTQGSATPSSRRWSYQTPATDSIASSPNSTYRPASLFDHERNLDSECTSPESAAFLSPVGRHKKQGSLDYSPLPDTLGRVIDDELAGLNMFLPCNEGSVPAIPEEHEDLSASFVDRPRTPHDLIRRKSHDSLFSVAGMDIHTPVRQSRPSRLNRHNTRRNLSCGGELLPTSPVIATTTITADGQAPSKPSEQSSRKLLESVAGTGNSTNSNSNSTTTTTTPAELPTRKPSLSRRVGGWVRGKWGGGSVDPPTAAVAGSTTSTAPSASVSGSITTQSQTSEDRPTTPNFPLGFPIGSFRDPGVNQKGPVWGFKPPGPAPTVLQPDGIDERLLRESLAE